MDKRKHAKRLLIHYFIMARTGAYHWDFDNISEIESIIGLIIDAAKDEIRQEIRSNENG